ncbi:MAG TPA: sigma-70 family RNA polymerase sigma factor [Acidimicrobiales bacterium]|nr:sigma-70 family RNA polymerase sigma factor [Acidimicrobiales bacterium]
MDETEEVDFRAFMMATEPRLHRALAAGLGWERGREATADALAYAWEQWPKVRTMTNPTGYLYRVGQSSVRRRKVPAVFERPHESESHCEPALSRLLADLPERQRIAVILVHGFDWTIREVAELTGITPSTVHTHLERGLAKLRAALEVADHG